MIGFASDSASVMVGRTNSVLSQVIQQQPDIFFMGCVCHLAATTISNIHQKDVKSSKLYFGILMELHLYEC